MALAHVREHSPPGPNTVALYRRAHTQRPDDVTHSPPMTEQPPGQQTAHPPPVKAVSGSTITPAAAPVGPVPSSQAPGLSVPTTSAAAASMHSPANQSLSPAQAPQVNIDPSPAVPTVQPIPPPTHPAAHTQHTPHAPHLRIGPYHGQLHSHTLSPAPPDVASEHRGDPAKRVTAVQTYLRDVRFSGDHTKSIHHSLRDYDLCCQQLQLSQQERTEMFVNLFTGSARWFLFDHANPRMNFNELVRVMVTEFGSDARQLTLQSTLEPLTLTDFMQAEDTTDIATGLASLIERINLLAPQAPPPFRSDL